MGLIHLFKEGFNNFQWRTSSVFPIWKWEFLVCSPFGFHKYTALKYSNTNWKATQSQISSYFIIHLSAKQFWNSNILLPRALLEIVPGPKIARWNLHYYGWWQNVIKKRTPKICRTQGLHSTSLTVQQSERLPTPILMEFHQWDQIYWSHKCPYVNVPNPSGPEGLLLWQIEYPLP